MINVFIPHRWSNEDYIMLSALLDKTKYQIRDYSVPKSSPFDSIMLIRKFKNKYSTQV